MLSRPQLGSGVASPKSSLGPAPRAPHLLDQASVLGQDVLTRAPCLAVLIGTFIPLQSIPWKWLFGATAVALGGVALSVVIAARN